MSISLVSNAFLDESSAKIKARVTSWDGYHRADLITSEELVLIKKVDRQPSAKVESVLLSEGPTYAKLYLDLLKRLSRVDTILVFIADALTGHDERIPLFTRTASADPDLPYVPLLRALENQDVFVQLKAAQILTILLSSETGPLPPSRLVPFLKVLSSLVQDTSPNKRDVAVQCLEFLLSRQEVRKMVWATPAIILGLLDILKNNPGPQMSYQVAFCLWLLSFEQDIAEKINKQFDIIPLLVDVAQSALKEKIIRVIIATFRNLVTKAPAANLPAMLVAHLLPFVKNLCARKWSDEDILEDVQFLRDELNARFQSLTTYDEYTSELSSGHLSWTPVHESEDFWKENATKLNEKDYEHLKILVKLLKDSNDSMVLAVAAHDVGQYVKHYERGKKLVTDLGGKARVMELMTHQNADVRYHALISVQLLLSQPWVSV